MKIEDGKIHLSDDELEALNLISPCMMEKMGQVIDPQYLRENLEALHQEGLEKYNDLMQNRWDNEDQRRRARNDETTKEMLEMFTYMMARDLSKKYLDKLDEALAPRH